MKRYIELITRIGKPVVQQEELTDEEKEQRYLERILGNEEEQNGARIISIGFGDWVEYPLFIPVNIINEIVGGEYGTEVHTNNGMYLVTETPKEVISKITEASLR